MNTLVFPSVNRLYWRYMSSSAKGSREAVGSSRMTTGAFLYSARANISFLHLPAGQLCAIRVQNCRRLVSALWENRIWFVSGRLAPDFRPGGPAEFSPGSDRPRWKTVGRQKQIRPENHRKFLEIQFRLNGRNVYAVQQDTPFRRVIQAAQKLDQSGLSRAVGSHQSQLFSCLQRQIDVFQCVLLGVRILEIHMLHL